MLKDGVHNGYDIPQDIKFLNRAYDFVHGTATFKSQLRAMEKKSKSANYYGLLVELQWFMSSLRQRLGSS